MTTLIILVILFAIAIIGLIIISIKKFSDKTDYILSAISLLSADKDNINSNLKLINVIKDNQIKNTNRIMNYVENGFSSMYRHFDNITSTIDTSNKALVNSINAIEEKLSTVPNCEDIIDSDELVNRIAEGLYNKMNDFQAKNSLPADKVEKPSPAKSKHRTRARKANNSYNSVQDAPQQKVNED